MIFFDTETTGLLKPKASPIEKQPHIIEIGAIKTDDEFKIIEQVSMLFSIPISLPQKITEITGISADDLDDKPSFCAQSPRLCEFFKGEMVWVGHNIMFDYDILMLNLRRCGKGNKLSKPSRLVCTANESIFLHGFRLKLNALHKLATGENFTGAHRAIVDAEATMNCYKWLRNEHGVI